MPALIHPALRSWAAQTGTPCAWLAQAQRSAVCAKRIRAASLEKRSEPLNWAGKNKKAGPHDTDRLAESAKG